MNVVATITLNQALTILERAEKRLKALKK